MTELNGTYNIYLDGKKISSKNLITTSGKEIIKQYLAGNLPSWSGSIAVGTISTAAAVGDTSLKFEVDRRPTITKGIDPNGNIVLRAAFPLDLSLRINEVGVFPFVNTTANGRYQDSIITDFSEPGWTPSLASDTVNVSYVGSSNMKLDSTYTSATLTGLNIDISGYSSTDKFQLLVNNLDSNTKTITLTFKDGNISNNTTVTFPNIISSGLQSVEVAIGSTNITSINEIVLSSTNTNKNISLDCLKFLNADESGYALNIVSRSIPTEVVKLAGQDLEIEYILAGL